MGNQKKKILHIMRYYSYFQNLLGNIVLVNIHFLAISMIQNQIPILNIMDCGHTVVISLILIQKKIKKSLIYGNQSIQNSMMVQ